ncbi:glutamine-synthetase adenylyltransferase [Wenxinia saemankumensis]|uniref:Glutamate-ammonia-ligase adenylyltransferase n=1 Tax=Wenxinia saemankumensis TaxID=1447782 RepID=A0A1M6AHU7_9RHOB|nr:glutamine-synthetase adenylyltransferase [Wenxinia saemankumensis]SHI36080.1 glutamate-ammonia-ligase adenylyltransferase [Wenxinia saemankumensis]
MPPPIRSLAARQTRAPRPFDADRGREALDCFDPGGEGLRDLIAGTAGCSPYLAGLIAREAEWLGPALDDPEGAVDGVLAGIEALDLGELDAGLRQAKRRVALIAALADLSGAWPLEEVTGALTRLADTALHRAATLLVGQRIARGRMPGLGEEDVADAGGLAIFAMGKMGAFELNYSSDIDLICLFDESRISREDYPETRAGFVAVVRKLAQTMSDVTAEGYVFRTDLRLRPDASVTPVAMAMAGAETYYESVGRTWERAAWIKARSAAGAVAAGERFQDTLTPFVWRRHLDFAAIQDAHDMRLRIRDHKGLGGPLSLPGHDMKLGRGGIREIEFFAQTRQLIAGGRDRSLRVRGTVPALDRLAAAGWIPADVAGALTGHYRFHREIEHRLQMIADTQTQELPETAEGWDRLAAFCGQERAALEAALKDRLEAVHATTEEFFAPNGGDGAAPRPAFGTEIVARWPSYPALRSPRAGEIFRRVEPEILARLEQAARPEEALAAFDAFLAGLPAGVQLFSLFEANPNLIALLAEICATAPALARYLSSNARVLDAVIAGHFFAPWPGAAALTEELARTLALVPDYEARLDRARAWMKEWHFRTGVHQVRGLIPATEAGAQYADLAEAVIAALWPVVGAEFARRHGPAPGRGAMVLGMGSLGAGRLNAASDLDLIVIYDAAGQEASEGRRPLPARTYFARLTQSLVTALSAPMAEGRLYEVDMRLRPSGRQGPVATSLAGFESYQRGEAWTWEHLALTRARGIAGDPGLCAEVEEIRRAVLIEKAKGASLREDVAAMRARLREAKPPQGRWDAKFGPGRLMEVELAAQTVALLAGAPVRDVPGQIAVGRTDPGSARKGQGGTGQGGAEQGGMAQGLAAADRAALSRADDLFWSLQSAARLLTGGALHPEELGTGGCRFVLRSTGLDSTEALGLAMEEAGAAASAAFDRLLESPP